MTLLGDVIFVFNLPSYWTVFADGFLSSCRLLGRPQLGCGRCGTLAAAVVAAMKSLTCSPAARAQPAIVLAYVLVIVLAILGELVAGGFLSISHIDQLLIEASFIAFVALGQSFVILSGGIDLSIPWVLNGGRRAADHLRKRQ